MKAMLWLSVLLICELTSSVVFSQAFIEADKVDSASLCEKEAALDCVHAVSTGGQCSVHSECQVGCSDTSGVWATCLNIKEIKQFPNESTRNSAKPCMGGAEAVACGCLPKHRRCGQMIQRYYDAVNPSNPALKRHGNVYPINPSISCNSDADCINPHPENFGGLQYGCLSVKFCGYLAL